MQKFFLLFLAFTLNTWGAELKLPALTSPVMDLAGMMTEAERNDLSQLAYTIHTNNGPQITILTVPDMQDYPIEEFSIRVAEKWQLGSKEKDDGLLIVLAKAERQVRIEVGGGIEGEITDYDSAEYTRRIFPSYFKRADFHGGFKVFMEDVAGRFNIKLSEGNRLIRRAPSRGPFRFGNIILIALAVILGLGSLFRNRMARGVFTGVGFTGVSLFLGIPIVMMVAIFIFGLALGLIGVGNLLAALAHGSRYSGGGGGGGFGGGGGGWSGGGGGFSGGGSSGSW